MAGEKRYSNNGIKNNSVKRIDERRIASKV